MATPPATVAEFKTQFDRDFVYGPGLDKVRDGDIDRAMADAQPYYNPALFSTADGKQAFLYASAHFLVTNIQGVGGLAPAGAPNLGGGIENQGDQVTSNKGAGGLSVGNVAPPDFIKNNPNLLQFWTTTYGQRYAGMVAPRCVGNVGVVSGPVSPGAIGTPNIPYAGP